MNEFEDDLIKLMEDYPHPKIIIDKYKIAIGGNNHEYYMIYENNKLAGCFERSQDVIDYLEEVGFYWKSMDYVIE